MKRFYLVVVGVCCVLGMFGTSQIVQADKDPDWNNQAEKDKMAIIEQENNPNLATTTPKTAQEEQKETSERLKKTENNEKNYEKQDEKQGGITLRGKEYPLTTYKGHSTGGMIEQGILTMSNGIFWFSKLIYSGIDEGLNFISSQDLIHGNAKIVSGVAESLWTELSSVYGVILIAIAAICAFFFMAVRGDVINGVQTIVKVVLVFVVGTVFMAKADTVIETLDDVSAELQGTVLKVGKAFQEDYQEIPEGQERDGTVAILRNVWFDIAVYRPYLIMNYGTLDVQALTKEDPDRIDSLVRMEKSEKYKKKVSDKINDEAKEQHNTFMDGEGDGVFSKLAISLFTLVVVIALGVPFLTLSLANLIIQFAVLGIILIFPFSLLMSLLPKFGNSAYKLLGKLVISFLAKGMIALFVLFIVLAVTIVDSSVSLARVQEDVPVDNPIGRYILHTLVLVVMLNVLIGQRSKILSMITGGRVQLGQAEGAARRGMGGLLMFGAALTGLSRRFGRNRTRQNGTTPEGGEGTRPSRRNQLSKTIKKSLSGVRNKFSKKRKLNPTNNGEKITPRYTIRRQGSSAPIGQRPNRPTRKRPQARNGFSSKRQLPNRRTRNRAVGNQSSPKRQLQKKNRLPKTARIKKATPGRTIKLSSTSGKRLKSRFKTLKREGVHFVARRPKTSEKANNGGLRRE